MGGPVPVSGKGLRQISLPEPLSSMVRMAFRPVVLTTKCSHETATAFSSTPKSRVKPGIITNWPTVVGSNPVWLDPLPMVDHSPTTGSVGADAAARSAATRTDAQARSLAKNGRSIMEAAQSMRTPGDYDHFAKEASALSELTLPGSSHRREGRERKRTCLYLCLLRALCG